jgi:hypothetical protein
VGSQARSTRQEVDHISADCVREVQITLLECASTFLISTMVRCNLSDICASHSSSANNRNQSYKRSANVADIIVPFVKPLRVRFTDFARTKTVTMLSVMFRGVQSLTGLHTNAETSIALMLMQRREKRFRIT